MFLACTETAGVLLLPSRESLNLGERLMVYLPRCADTVPSIPKCAAQVMLLNLEYLGAVMLKFTASCLMACTFDSLCR